MDFGMSRTTLMLTGRLWNRPISAMIAKIKDLLCHMHEVHHFCNDECDVRDLRAVCACVQITVLYMNTNLCKSC